MSPPARPLRAALAPARACAAYLVWLTASPAAHATDPSPAPGVARLPAVTVTADDDPGTTDDTGQYTTRSMSTATGLPLSIRETPQSVSVVTRQAIEDQGLRDTAEILQSAPGISATRSDSNRFSFSSRGFAIDTFQFDGLQSPILGAWNFGATDMDSAIYDRVEVVRGATGLLTGAGNPSAAVNFIRKRPGRDFAASGSATLGRWHARRVEGDLTVPFTQDGRVRGRLVAAHARNDSYVSLLDSDRKTLYGVVSADLTPATQLTASLEYQRNQGNGFGSGFPLFYSDGTRTDFPRDVANNTRWSAFETESTTGFLDFTHRLGNAWQLRAAASRTHVNYRMTQLFRGGYPDQETGLGMTGSFSNYRGERDRNDVHLSVNGPIDLLGRTHELSFGWMRVADDTDIQQYRMLGQAPELGNYFHWQSPTVAEPTWSNTLSPADDTRSRQQGAYAVGRFSVADPLHVILGSRWSRWETDQVYFGAVRQYDYSGVFTPYAGIVYDIDDTYSAYASYTSIFTPQNSRAPDGSLLDPIEGNAFEVGVKAAWLDGRINGALALYRTRQDNLAEAIPGEFVQGTTQQAYRPVSGATVKGVDVEVAGELTPGWMLGASVTRYTAESASGEPINTSHPRALAKLFTTYRLPGALRDVTVGGGVNWQSRMYQTVASPTGRQRVEQSGYALVNAMVRYDFNRNVSATLNVNNLFDKTYHSQIGFYSQGWWGEPRNVMLTVRARY